MQQKELFTVDEGVPESIREINVDSEVSLGNESSICSNINQKPRYSETGRDHTEPAHGMSDIMGARSNNTEPCNHQSKAIRLGVSGSKRRAWHEKEDKRQARASTARELMKLAESQSYQCAACKMPLTPRDSEIDHVLPRASGGTDLIDNLQWLCRRCNRAKGTLAMSEFIYVCKLVAENNP